MCGIAGVINYYEKRAVSKRLVRNMVSVIEHRGPDDVGFHVKGNAGLGIRRLSVIDIKKGHQPISNEDNSIWIVYNGEIYNYKELRQELVKKRHKFKTNSDTEVIIHLYEEFGRELVTRLNGMFAFALWDSKRQTLLLARDRAGIKPLFYYIGRDRLVFGSEMKSLLRDPSVPRELNLQALHSYLSLLYVPAPLTIFQGIKKLPVSIHAVSDREAITNLFFHLQSKPSKFSGYRSPGQRNGAEDRDSGIQKHGKIIIELNFWIRHAQSSPSTFVVFRRLPDAVMFRP